MPGESSRHKAPGFWMATGLSVRTKGQGGGSALSQHGSSVYYGGAATGLTDAKPDRSMSLQAVSAGRVSSSGGGKGLSQVCSAKGCASYHSSSVKTTHRQSTSSPCKKAADDKDCKCSNSLVTGSI